MTTLRNDHLSEKAIQLSFSPSILEIDCLRITINTYLVITEETDERDILRPDRALKSIINNSIKQTNN